MLGAYARKRVAAGAHLPVLGFEPAKRPDVEPITAWAAVSFPRANAHYSFLQLGGLGLAL